MCGYVCCNCGKCKGKSNFAKSAGTCFSCGTANDPAVQLWDPIQEEEHLNG